MLHHRLRRLSVLLCLSLLLMGRAAASAYDARPKLVVVIVIDQLRADQMQRLKPKFTDGGFRMLMERGAYFTECNYEYVNTHTAPGHATIFTGTYTDGHNIIGNDWWNRALRKPVTSVEDQKTKIVGGPDASEAGASPFNLTANTIGDELRLATSGKARVFGVSLKDRSAILPAGHSGTAYWIDRRGGAWVSSTYYMDQLPAWAADFNRSKRADKYWNLEWKDAAGKTHKTERATKPDFYNNVGGTPFGIAYQLEFVRELIANEKLGAGPTTDFLSVSISGTDISGHTWGPYSPEQEAVLLAADKELSEFFAYLGRQVGLANVWIALAADHGVAATLQDATTLKIPNGPAQVPAARAELNNVLAQKLGRKAEFVPYLKDRNVFLDPAAFGAMKRPEAEALVAEAMLTPAVKQKLAIDHAIPATQILEGRMPANELSRKWAHSVAPQLDAWYVMGLPAKFTVGNAPGTDHLSAWSYDTSVPLALFGLPFQPGTYRTATEPVDLSVTLASMLGITKPSHAVGRVLTEAIKKEQP